jgi:hypothetical protein
MATAGKETGLVKSMQAEIADLLFGASGLTGGFPSEVCQRRG